MQLHDRNSLFKEKFGLFCGALSILSAFIFIIIAYLNSPGYDPVNQTISKLGITPYGSLPFAFGTVLSGISFIFYFLFYLNGKISKPGSKFLDLHLSTLFGILGGIFLAGVGLFPDKEPFIVLHFVSAFFFFSFFGFSILLISLNLEVTEIDSRVEFLRIFGLLVVFLAILHGIFSTIDFYGPIWQKISVISYFFWYSWLMIYFWKK
ncbi:MAG: DUF998 domain-containing protein [Candidatus Hodarchaeales archaeon]|jgi:hypothetical membrane protein